VSTELGLGRLARPRSLPIGCEPRLNSYLRVPRVRVSDPLKHPVYDMIRNYYDYLLYRYQIFK